MKFRKAVIVAFGVAGMLGLAAVANAKTSDRVVDNGGQSVRQASDVVVASNGSNRRRTCTRTNRGTVCR